MALHSLDRLICIILNDFLPYYQFWKPADRQTPVQILERDRLAHKIWENDWVCRNSDGSYEVQSPP